MVEKDEGVLRGVVLAGGASTRFGTDKLWHRVEGKPMLDRALMALQEAMAPDGAGTGTPVPGPKPVISVHSVSQGTLIAKRISVPAAVVTDTVRPGWTGPAAGMLSALARFLGDEVLFIPGDMPWLSGPELRVFVEEAHRARVAVACPVWPNGRVEPLIQWHHASAGRTELHERTDRQEEGIRPTDLIRGNAPSGLVPVAGFARSARSLANVNQPGDRPVGAPTPWGDPTGPVTILPEGAFRHYGLGGRAVRKKNPVQASKEFQMEAGLYAEIGVGHLEMHALVDAARCLDVGDPTRDRLEARIGNLKAELYPESTVGRGTARRDRVV